MFAIWAMDTTYGIGPRLISRPRFTSLFPLRADRRMRERSRSIGRMLETILFGAPGLSRGVAAATIDQDMTTDYA
jgi:hypothetical protein